MVNCGFFLSKYFFEFQWRQGSYVYYWQVFTIAVCIDAFVLLFQLFVSSPLRTWWQCTSTWQTLSLCNIEFSTQDSQNIKSIAASVCVRVVVCDVFDTCCFNKSVWVPPEGGAPGSFKTNDVDKVVSKQQLHICILRAQTGFHHTSVWASSLASFFI